MENQIYCSKCKTRTATENITNKVSAKGMGYVQGTCSVCGTRKNKFTGKASNTSRDELKSSQMIDIDKSDSSEE